MLCLEMLHLNVTLYLGEKEMNKVKMHSLITNVRVGINAPNLIKHTTVHHIIVIVK